MKRNLPARFRWGALAAATAAVGLGLLALTWQLQRDSNGPPTVAPQETASTVPSVPATALPASAPCTPENSVPSGRTIARGREVVVAVFISVTEPCRMEGTVTITLSGPNQAPLPVTGNPASVDLDYTASQPGDYQLAEASWTNWCGETGFYQVDVTFPPKTTNERPSGWPPCAVTGEPSRLQARAVDPDAPVVSLPRCDPAGYGLFPKFIALPGGGLQIDVYGRYLKGPGSACRMNEPMQLTVIDGADQPLPLIVNGATASVDAPNPTDEPIARFAWFNWCGEATAPIRLRLGFAGVTTLVRVDNPPACEAPGSVSKLEVMGPLVPPMRPPTPTPIPGGLRPASDVPANPQVWIYRDAQPASTRCTEIIGDMVPATAAGSVPARPFTCSETDGRLRFATDGSPALYLLGVELLLLAKNTLPQPSFGDGTCDSIRSHLVPASEPLSEAAYVLVCDVQPVVRGQLPRNPVLIWGRVVADLAPAVVPEGAPCWSLTRYLGRAGEARTIEVKCVLE